MASLSSGVVYADVPSWEENQVRKLQEKTEERRRLRLARRVVPLALDALGEGERQRIEYETSIASEDDLKRWLRRAPYASTWDELVGARPLEGLALVRWEKLLHHAIADPLRCWCVLLLFTPSRNEELDYDRVLYGAPWVAEAWHSLFGVVDELRRHSRALVRCKSERLARGIAATINEKRLGAFIYGPTGEMRG
ncbi:MAG: hypothetical protein WAM82_24795 [Thermoanaerobaculia bacterium]